MLRFESIYWATKDKQTLIKKLEGLGFLASPSRRDPQTTAIFFGPDAIEIFSPQDQLNTLITESDFQAFVESGGGVYALSLETDSIARDYKRIKSEVNILEKPRRSSPTAKGLAPDWYGFNLSENLTPSLKAWVVMNSNDVLKKRASETLPLTHPNSCFGLEGIHLLSGDPEATIKKWSYLLEKSASGLQWNELVKARAFRLQSSFKFFDIVQMEKGSREGVFMLTLNVTDLERAKEICKKAGAQTLPCHSRDGFIVPAEFTGGPALRFTRAYWKRYIPSISANFPEGRRPDRFRPLGGADTSTLSHGFEDDWTY